MRMIPLLLAAALLAAPSTSPAQTAPPMFAPEMAAFAEADRLQPPKPCGVLFVGSSSVRFWRTLSEDMAPVAVVNRGFGGSTIADVNRFFDVVVKPYRPRAIVFYAGENDINAGAEPAAVAEEFHRFMDRKTQAFGSAPVYFVSLKPSKARYAQLARQADVNARVRRMTRDRRDLHYIDVVAPMLENGRPRDIFVADDLHMTPAGYAIWTRVIRPVVLAEAKRPTACRAD
jgi:lysophospholipase L1-like esterase